MASQPPTHAGADPFDADTAVVAFSVAWERYRAYLVADRHRTATTATAYRQPLWSFAGPNGFLERRTRPKHWTKATRELFTDFLAASRPRARTGFLAPKSVELYVTAGKSFYGFATSEGWVRRDPLARLTVPSCEAAIPRAIPWEASRFGPGLRTLFAACDLPGTDPRLRLMVLLAYRAGLRCAEVASLRVEHVNLGGEVPVLYVTGKGSRERSVPLLPWLADELAAHLAARTTRGPVIESLTHPGDHLTAKAVSKLLNGKLRDLGIKNDAGGDATAHGLRHTFAHDMARLGRGRNERAIGIALGHRPGSAVTRRYTVGYDLDVVTDVLALPDRRAG
ncbi:MAG TPA: tyrosine-type recombinase/integrase [Actinomycetes bacterium]|nr:tyrosine-type recombinase/integrase [Actinomycetes bacterium]